MLWFFQWSCMDVKVGLWRKLSAEELMLFNCGTGKDSWESLDCKEIQPVHSEGDKSWVFIGRTDAEAETPILWPPDAKSWLIWKDSDAGKVWGQEEKGTPENETVGWHHWVNGHGFGWTPAAGDGQWGLARYGSWGHKDSDMTERLNWAELNWRTTCGPRFIGNPTYFCSKTAHLNHLQTTYLDGSNKHCWYKG